MILRLPQSTLRPWSAADVDAVARHANDRDIWLNLRDRFPHPYTRADAEMWIAHASKNEASCFAIEVDGEAAGGLSFQPMGDVERHTAEIGYWLGKPYWGRGIATIAVVAATAYAFEHLGLERIEAGVYEWNAASTRVLVKAGYSFEGRLRRRIVKDQRIGDVLMYARLRGDVS
ncbi:GNAT family N-acetyltransferase [Pendulispora rubella]|uniref:GNAT family N-acetyltransferase n=1 Tax=Pendulispora rubella TaxID=2741070 RepID=A0ABZ2L5Z4_9BACT